MKAAKKTGIAIMVLGFLADGQAHTQGGQVFCGGLILVGAVMYFYGKYGPKVAQ